MGERPAVPGRPSFALSREANTSLPYDVGPGNAVTSFYLLGAARLVAAAYTARTSSTERDSAMHRNFSRPLSSSIRMFRRLSPSRGISHLREGESYFVTVSPPHVSVSVDWHVAFLDTEQSF
jgi:hypothetical protein